MAMETIAAVTIKGRPYFFTHDDRDMTGSGLDTLGSVHNSRGQFAGLVVRDIRTGRTIVIGSAGRRASGAELHAALKGLS